ncbi:uncharacterized protein DNG_05165 [Cephalotrichum gorgonifer]|uniref:NB-ARC domain-containing protein n=1 Tax=Cephalotrichum gorgonifer TaxID=2041049 RepID=A0AAE8SW13_9PEZI|nr:uncharacterized protein DNG_05165 [Cephalotrichum gorgonifer]
MPHIHRTGFTLLADGGGDGDGLDRCNIIFVHGLRGHSQRTWGDDVDDGQVSASSSKPSLRGLFRSRQKETSDHKRRSHPYWPLELLPTDVPDARIWTYGYDADVIEGVFGANNQNSISQHGRDLKEKLGREVEKGPIIFVAHSLGGIIVKDVIHRAEALQQRTRAVVFLGTPHRGSSTITGGLKVDSEILGNIHEQFIKIATRQNIRIHSFQEARGMSGIKGVSGKIVSDFSSILGLPDEAVETLNADHRQMVKCTGKTDDRYRAISGVLKQLVRYSVESFPIGPDSGSPPVSSFRDQSRPDTIRAEGLASNVSHFFVPFRENRQFVGRETVLADLRDALFDDSGPQTVAIVGLGGVGKTQVALQMAYYTKNKPDWSVFWLPALSISGFEQACTQLASELSLPTSGQEDPKELVRSYLSSSRSGLWTLIIDNADDRDAVFGATGTEGSYDYLPQSTKGRILFMTRSRDVAQAVNADKRVDLEEMSEREARDFLHNLLPKVIPLADDGSMGELLRTLAFLPLAISQAAAYMDTKGTTVSKYLSLLQDSDKEAISLLSREFPDRTRYSKSRHAVATTWLVSFKHIQRTDGAAAQLLSFISQIEPRAIPEAMLPRTGTEEELENAVGTLSAYAFLQRREDGKTLEMHSLVHLAARVWVQQEIDGPSARQAAVAHLATVFDSDDWDDRERWRQYMPHVLKVLRDGGGTGESEEECELGFWAGRCLNAIDLLEHVVKVREIRLPEDHRDRLASQHALATAYQANGQVKEAIHMLEHVVKAHEMILAENHPSLLASQHELARAYKANGQAQDAVKLLEHVVAVEEKTLAEDHPDRLTSQHVLARAYRANGQVQDAVKLLEHVVAVDEKMFAEDHPDRLSSQRALAGAYEALAAKEKISAV